MDNFYPIILFFFVLIFERLSIMWLEDRFGTSEQVMQLFTKITAAVQKQN